MQEEKKLSELELALLAIKDTVQKHQSGEIYMTWKGDKIAIKFSRHLNIDPLRQDTLDR